MGDDGAFVPLVEFSESVEVWELTQPSLLLRLTPRLRSDCQSEGADIVWPEIFLDLLFIGIAGQIDGYLQYHHRSWPDLLLAFTFVLFHYLIWSDCTFFLARFEGSNIYSSMILIIFYSGSLSMGIFTASGWAAHRSISLSIAVTRIALAFLYLPILFSGHQSAPLACLWCSIALIEAIVFVGIAAFRNPSITTFVWLMFGPWIFIRANLPSAFSSTHLPLDDRHISDRHCNWILIFLGQSILSLMSVNPVALNEIPVSRFTDVHHMGTAMVGFGLVFCLMRLYLSEQTQQTSRQAHHALSRHWMTRKVFVALHPLVGTSILGIGTGLKLMVDESIAHPDVKRTNLPSSLRLLTGSLLVCLILISILRFLHPLPRRRTVAWLLRALLLLPIIFLVEFGACFGGNCSASVAVCTAVVVLLAVCDAIAPDRNHDD